MSNMSTNLSALSAFSTGLQGAAYNIANVNTAGFKPVAVHQQSGRPADLGAHSVVTRPKADSVELSDQSQSLVQAPSQVDAAREMTSMIVNQRSFQANTVVISAADDLLGALVDMMV